MLDCWTSFLVIVTLLAHSCVWWRLTHLANTSTLVIEDLLLKPETILKDIESASSIKAILIAFNAIVRFVRHLGWTRLKKKNTVHVALCRIKREASLWETPALQERTPSLCMASLQQCRHNISLSLCSTETLQSEEIVCVVCSWEKKRFFFSYINIGVPSNSTTVFSAL